MMGTEDWRKFYHSAQMHPEVRIDGWKYYHRTTPAQARNFRRALHQLVNHVHVFNLSDDLVWAITKLSIEIDPVTLFDHAKRTRMPFAFTQFTWRGKAKRAAMVELGLPIEDAEQSAADDGEHPALLVTTGGDYPDLKHVEYLMHSTRDRSILFNPTTILINIPPATPTLADTNFAWSAHNDEKQPSHFALSDVFDRVNVDGFLCRTHWLLCSNIVARYPEASKAIEADKSIGFLASGPIVAMVTAKKMSMDFLLAGTGGCMRFFAALCFLMNQERVVRYVQATPNPLPLGARPREVDPEHASLLTTFLPREKIITLIHRAQHPHASPGEHDVIGFWSVTRRRGDPACNGGKHHWPAQPTRRQKCSACDAERWWKPASKRGHGPLKSKHIRRLDFSGVDVAKLIEQQKT